MSVTPLLGVLEWTPEQLARGAAHVAALPESGYAPVFFTAHEWRTVHVLADLVIPRDAKSGSATDAKVPEFMDFMLNEGSETRKASMRSGLAWLDAESRRRFGTAFVDASDAQHRQVLDDIAWPARAREEMAAGVTFFNMFRDMTAGGFFSSRIGYEDLDYRGRPKREWHGCPDDAMRKLGVSHDLMERR